MYLQSVLYGFSNAEFAIPKTRKIEDLEFGIRETMW